MPHTHLVPLYYPLPHIWCGVRIVGSVANCDKRLNGAWAPENPQNLSRLRRRHGGNGDEDSQGVRGRRCSDHGRDHGCIHRHDVEPKPCYHSDILRCLRNEYKLVSLWKVGWEDSR